MDEAPIRRTCEQFKTLRDGLALTPDSALVFTKSEKGGNCWLQKRTLEGAARWSQPLASWSVFPPLVLKNMIIVGDGSNLRAYDFDGMLGTGGELYEAAERRLWAIG